MFSKKLSMKQIWKVHDEMRGNINHDIEEVIKELSHEDMEIGSQRWNIYVAKRCELEASRRTLDLYMQKLQIERVK